MKNLQKSTVSLVECVPNVSEGRNLDAIKKMALSISQCSGVTLLHTDSNYDANRTVFTFAGTLDSVCNAVVQLVKVASVSIDMRTQQGEHIRNGAVDVCPLIPVTNITTEECITGAKRVGEQLGELGIPVYLYGLAASQPQREPLSFLRKGQYEALQSKLTKREWKPDYGPTSWDSTVARMGSTQVGVRPFLIALNASLETSDVRIAKNIARKVRTSGFRKTAGEFEALKADGWWMQSYNCAQVTMNFTNFKVTPPHVVLDRISELAQQYSTKLTGSELIGLIPETALQMAGEHYFKRNPSLTVPSFEDTIQAGIQQLGLTFHRNFKSDERIFERCEQRQKKLK